LLDYDKYKTQLIKLTAKTVKDPIKQGEAEKKFEEAKELYKRTNDELVEEIKQHYEQQYKEFKSQYKQLIVSQTGLYKNASECFKSLIELPPVEDSGSRKTVRKPVKTPEQNTIESNSDDQPAKSVSNNPPPQTKKETNPGPSLPKKDSTPALTQQTAVASGPTLPTKDIYPNEQNPFEQFEDSDYLAKPPARPPPSVPPKVTNNIV